MKLVEFPSIEDFWYHMARKRPGSSVYRGQWDASWKLETRWQRFLDRLSISEKSEVLRKKINERYKAELFKANRILRSNSDIDLDDETALEVYGQHYGLPTRLMDWSNSYYVALFFAADASEISVSNSQNMAVFEIDVSKFVFASAFLINRDEKMAKSDQAVKYAFGKTVGFDNPRILNLERPKNSRVLRQDGLFLFLNEGVLSLDDYELACTAVHPDCEFLTKYVLPSSERLKVVRALQDMGSSASSIYQNPDLASSDAVNFILSEYL